MSLRDAANRTRHGRIGLTFAAAGGGGFAFHAAGLPAGWIAGSLLVVALVSLAGLHTEVPAPLRSLVYLFLGIFAGSGVRPEIIDQIATWPVSFAILAIAIGLIILATYAWLHHVAGWDRQTALLSGLPGALSFVVAAAEAVGADMRKVAVNQSVRLLVLIEALPLAVYFLGGPAGPPPGVAGGGMAGAGAGAVGADMRKVAVNQSVRLLVLIEALPLAVYFLGGPAGPPPGVAAGAMAAAGLDWPDLALLLGAGAAGSYLGARSGLPGGLMLGGLLTSAALYLTGAVDLVVPQWLVTPGVVALGAIAGSRFRPGDTAVLREIAGPVLVAFAIGMSIAVIAAGLATLLLGVPLAQTLIAFAPGALDALTVLAFTLDMDPAYVAAHHVVRFVVLAVTIPFVARKLAGGAQPPGGQAGGRGALRR